MSDWFIKKSYFRNAHVIIVLVPQKDDSYGFPLFFSQQGAFSWHYVIGYCLFRRKCSTVLSTVRLFIANLNVINHVCAFVWNTYMRIAMSSRYKIVVQGEASETDSDDEVYITSLPPPQTATVGLKVVLYSNLSSIIPRLYTSWHSFTCGVSSDPGRC